MHQEEPGGTATVANRSWDTPCKVRTPGSYRRGRAVPLGPSYCSYSPECVEEEFSGVRIRERRDYGEGRRRGPPGSPQDQRLRPPPVPRGTNIGEYEDSQAGDEDQEAKIQEAIGASELLLNACSQSSTCMIAVRWNSKMKGKTERRPRR
jgi:hypothetical protein